MTARKDYVFIATDSTDKDVITVFFDPKKEDAESAAIRYFREGNLPGFNGEVDYDEIEYYSSNSKPSVEKVMKEFMEEKGISRNRNGGNYIGIGPIYSGWMMTVHVLIPGYDAALDPEA